MIQKEYISHEKGSDESWICICGNRPDSDGFQPCNANGNEIEPLAGSDWDNLYVCCRCGRIIQEKTLEVIGRKACNVCNNPKSPDCDYHDFVPE